MENKRHQRVHPGDRGVCGTSTEPLWPAPLMRRSLPSPVFGGCDSTWGRDFPVAVAASALSCAFAPRYTRGRAHETCDRLANHQKAVVTTLQERRSAGLSG